MNSFYQMTQLVEANYDGTIEPPAPPAPSNPLQSLMHLLRMLRQGSVNPYEVEEMLTTIEVNDEQTARIIDMIEREVEKTKEMWGPPAPKGANGIGPVPRK